MSTLIYLLDDDVVSAGICADILGALGCLVKIYYDADVLVDAMGKQSPDLVFMDLTTDGVDGLSLSRRIRQDLATVKIVVMEEKSSTEKVSATNVAADAYLEKPFGHGQVSALLRQLETGGAEVRFWGVRGSIASPGLIHDRYGGNTSCVTVKLALDEYIIFDAGTGIREFGNYLVRLGLPVKLHMLITHAHWDHIQGLPFFRPGYLKRNDMALYGPNQPNAGFEQVLADQMHNTYFPVPLQAMQATLHFHPLKEGQYEIAGAKVDTLYLHHPGTTLGYRIRLRDKTLVYMCDNEITDDPLLRKRLLGFLRSAHIAIADAQYTPSDFPDKLGWGHSSFIDVVDLAVEAGVQKLFLTHHDPDRSDDALDQMVLDSRNLISARGSNMECTAAAEGSAHYL